MKEDLTKLKQKYIIGNVRKFKPLFTIKDGIIKEDKNLRNAMESENEYGLNLISKRDFGNGEGGGFGQKNNVQ